jgi:hypothetical protein
MLESFAAEIWLVEGPTTDVAGFKYPTRMAVVRLADHRLVIWSPVALSDAVREAVDGLGRVQYLVAPNSLHHLFLEEWRRAYPEARLFAAPGLRKRRADLTFDGDLADQPEPEWADELDQVQVRPEPQVPLKFRLAFTDRRAARAALGRILAWPAEKVVMAHAEPVRADGRAFIERTFRWLLQ